MSKFKRLATCFGLLAGLGLASGGCKLECACNGGDSVQDTIDEIGDEAEDVAEELQKD